MNSKLYLQFEFTIYDRSIQEELSNAVIWIDVPIVLEEVDRIEMVRGPSSAIWGAKPTSVGLLV